MAVTAGYHRLWAHRTYEAHCRAAHLLSDLRHHGAAEQRVHLVQRAPQPSPARRRRRPRPVLGAARLLVLAHRLDAARVPERRTRPHQHPGPQEGPAARLPAPLLRAAGRRAEFRSAALRRSRVPRRVGHDDPRRRAAPRVEPSRHLLHKLSGPYVGHPPVHRGQHRARQPGAGGDHVRRGLPQLPPYLCPRLPQRRALVAVGSDQVADRGPRSRSG